MVRKLAAFGYSCSCKKPSMSTFANIKSASFHMSKFIARKNSAGSQTARPGQNNKAGPRVVKSAGSQRPKQGAKPAATKARAVIVSTKPKPTNNNRAIVKPNSKPAKQSVARVATKAPRQKIILQESQKKTAPKPAANANKQQNSRNAPATNSGRNASRPNSAASVPAARPRENNNASRNTNNGGPANQSELARALQTANSIAITRSHPKQAEVVELLRTHEKGWVDDRKFITLLKSLAF